MCRKTKACIDNKLVCDHKYDCTDGSDELTCGMFENKWLVKWLVIHGLSELKDLLMRGISQGYAGFYTPGFKNAMPDFIKESCGPEQVRCPETAPNRCIHYTSICDNKDDCGDGFDESTCRNDGESRDEEKVITIRPENVMNGHCAPGEFQCREGGCIPASSHCDQKYDCEDGSDETECKEHQAQIQRQRAEQEKNRRIEDCRRRGGFLCQGTDRCIERAYFCNGRSDCPNGDDEKNCPVSEEVPGWFLFLFARVRGNA
uniref:Uncharacterized protein n=1 Tax=Meloidogyne javanica TaxID=6303 RepID=A0A915MG87_MELJA